MIQSCTLEAAAGPLLTDVIHEVPRLLDFLYPHTAAVLAVNKALREYSHQQPANISLWDGNDVCQLTRGRCKWPQVRGLSLQSVERSRQDHIASLMRLPYLLSASWPQLKSLNLSDCFLEMRTLSASARATGLCWKLLISARTGFKITTSSS